MTKLKKTLKGKTKKVKDLSKKKIKQSKDKNYVGLQESSSNEDPTNGIKNLMIITKLIELMQADVDAAGIYKNAIEGIKNNENIIYELTLFRNDHLRHVDNLVNWIANPPERSVDIKGIIWTGYIKLRGVISGTSGFLKALLSSEKMIEQYYSEAITLDIADKNLKQVLLINFEDEKKHIKYIEEQLNILEKQ